MFDQVRDLITKGRLEPGDRLPSERELTLQLQVSRSSVREALLKLDLLGYVEQRHGEGCFVRSVTETPLSIAFAEVFQKGGFFGDLMEIRKVLETWSAHEAARRATDRQIIRMETALENMHKAKIAGEVGWELNLEFHCMIAAGTQNVLLIHLMRTLSDWLREITLKVYNGYYTKTDIKEVLYGQHWTILQAIRDKNPEAAKKAMETHLEFTGKSTRRHG